MRAEVVKSSIQKYGTAIEVINPSDNSKISTKAFIQPSRYVNKLNFGYQQLKIGRADLDTYIYIGPADVRVDTFPSNTLIKTKDDTFVLKRAQKMCFQDELIYIWGILQKYIPDN